LGLFNKEGGDIAPKLFETIPNTTVEEVEDRVVEYVLKHIGKDNLKEISIASFGPISLNVHDPDYGKILSAACEAKESWTKRSLVKELAKKLGVDLKYTYLHTDVTGSAMGELIYGTHCQKSSTLVYITVGTGVGIGVVVDGKPLKGKLHPEGGHVLVIKDERESQYPHFKGPCNYHRNCVENMITNNSIAERLGCKIDELNTFPDDHQVWDMIGFYLAQLCLSLTYIVSPHCIVIGGGILKGRKSIFPAIRSYLLKLNADYVKIADIEAYIREAEVEENAILGCATFSHDL